MTQPSTATSKATVSPTESNASGANCRHASAPSTEAGVASNAAAAVNFAIFQ